MLMKNIKMLDKLFIECPRCKHKQPEFLGVHAKTEDEMFIDSLKCKKCFHSFESEFLKNYLTLAVRKHQSRYQNNCSKCSKCAVESSLIFVKNGKLKCVDSDCNGTLTPKYNEQQLYLQLCYYSHIFNIKDLEGEREQKKAREEKFRKQIQIFKSLRKHIKRKYLLESAYYWVDLSKFCFAVPTKHHNIKKFNVTGF